MSDTKNGSASERPKTGCNDKGVKGRSVIVKSLCVFAEACGLLVITSQ